MTEKREWRPLRPQERFLASSAFEVLFGGAAGGGKSDALAIAPLRWVHEPTFRALLLRRTVPDLKRSGSLIERAAEYYLALGAQPREGGRVWLFPSGARVDFGAMELERDRMNYRSSQYQFIGFDELTTFTERQYTYLISRLRSAHGVPLRLRAATNPGGEGHDWVLKRFAPWLYPPGHMEYDGPRAAPGDVLWYQRDENGVDQIVEQGEPLALSRTFIPARATDNPYLGVEYLRNLDALDPVSRAQLKHGDWMARPARGAYFRRTWFTVVDRPPVRPIARVRYWDRAASEDGDWTVGLKMSRCDDGIYVVEHVLRMRGGPGAVEQTIKSTAEADGIETMVGIEEDPGQAGKFEAAYYVRELGGYNVRRFAARHDKVTRAQPVSAQADPGPGGRVGNVHLVRGAWVDAFLDELEAFPEGHDDQVDALSGAFSALFGADAGRARVVGVREAPHTGGF